MTAVLIVIIVLVLVFAIWFISVSNKFNTMKVKIEEANAGIDVALQKRYDTLTKLVDVVKGYAKHEKATLEEVTKLRNSVYDNMSNDDKIKTNEQLAEDIPKIMALAESYPDLKASESFKDLSKQLTKVEDDIANSRKYYNGVVRMFNNKVEMVPNNIFAILFGYRPKAMFQASENERDNVKVGL